MKVLLIIFTLAFVGLINNALAQPNLTDLRKYNHFTQKEVMQSINEIRILLEEFELSKSSAEIRAEEAYQFLELSYKAIQVDRTGESSDYLLATYHMDQRAFEKAMKKVEPKKVEALRQAMKHSARIMKSGQDPL